MKPAVWTALPGGGKVFEWFGKLDRTYFMQVSDSNDPLRKWKWAPLIESGNNQYISHQVIGTAATGFFRLKFTDQPIPAGETIDTADFDGDGVANIDEVSPPYYLHSTDPLNVDTDGDGLDDGRERWLSTDPNKADSDGDGLSDGDEYWIYSSDPTRIDTDGDGLGDGTEVNQTNTSPTIIDTDGDGTSDGDEIKQGTDPKSAASFIVQWRQITRSLSYDFNDYPPPSNRGNLSKTAEWNTALDTSETLAAAIPFPDLKARLETLAFPATPPATGGTNEIITSAGQSDLIPNPPCFHATMTHHRIWLRRPSATPAAFNQYALKITERTIDGAAQAPVVEVIQVTIPANAAVSDPVNLVEGFTQNFTGNTAHSESFTQRLAPIEVLDKDKNTVYALKVGKMAQAGVLTGTGSSAVLDIDKDPDRFYIRINGTAALGGISVKVSTVDNAVAAYNDNETEIDLLSYGTNSLSKSMLLVSDDVDDGHPVDGIADDVKGDRTHKVQLDGNFNIEGIKLGSGSWQTINAKTPVPHQKTVHVNIVRLADCGLAATAIENDITLAMERYAQVGVKLVVDSNEVKPVPSSMLTSQVNATIVGPFASPISNDSKFLIQAYGTQSIEDIHVFYCKSVSYELNAVAGYTYIENGFTGTLNGIYANNVLVSSGKKPFTLAHELGHVLTNRLHFGIQYSNTSYVVDNNLMAAGTSLTNQIESTKRLYLEQQGWIQSHRTAK